MSAIKATNYKQAFPYTKKIYARLRNDRTRQIADLFLLQRKKNNIGKKDMMIILPLSEHEQIRIIDNDKRRDANKNKLKVLKISTIAAKLKILW